MKKILKITAILGVVAFILSVLLWLVVRDIAVTRAEDKAQLVIEESFSIFSQTDVHEDEKVITLTRYVFENFQQQPPSEISLLRLRPYLTNHRLPDFLRLPSGVIETNIGRGLCDNAARMLAFILEQEGFQSVQWNMVSNKSGHSALLVTLSDARQVFVDPFYGVVALDENANLTHPKQAQEFVRAGRPLDKVLVPLNANSKEKFYKDFSSMSMSAEGQDLIIRSIIPPLKGQPFTLGDVNGKSEDVMVAGKINGMTSYWHYMGHKYNREWVRVLKAQEPVRVVMTLIDDVESNVLIADPLPVIEGKNLTWELNDGEQITFRDGKAKISLKRMNSFLEVDQVAFYPLAESQ